MPLYTPNEALPIYPTYTTVVKNGVKYKAYFETDWHQVMTEDGIPLCELLQNMPSIDTNNIYKYCGIFKSTPQKTAIEQLYELSSQNVGDVYLVQTDMLVDGGYVCESYVWLDNDVGWLYCGTTNRKASINKDLPDVIRLFPDKLGEAGQILVVGEDGKSITWGNAADLSFDSHNKDENAHPDIRESIEVKADKLKIFNDVLKSNSWVYNGDYPCFEYIYQSDKLPKKSYFEITAVIDDKEDSSILANASISPSYKIQYGENEVPYTILRAKRVPSADIDICVKVFGTYDEI